MNAQAFQLLNSNRHRAACLCVQRVKTKKHFFKIAEVSISCLDQELKKCVSMPIGHMARAYDVTKGISFFRKWISEPDAGIREKGQQPVLKIRRVTDLFSGIAKADVMSSTVRRDSTLSCLPPPIAHVPDVLSPAFLSSNVAAFKASTPLICLSTTIPLPLDGPPLRKPE